MARKILLCGVFMYIRNQFGASQSAVPLIIAVVVSMLYTVLLGFFRPYSDRHWRVLVIALSANVVVVFVMLAGVVIKLRQGASTAADDDALGVLLSCLLFAVPALVLVQALAELTCCGAGARAGAANRKGSVLVQAVSPIHQGTGGDGHTRKSSLRGASRKSAGATLDGQNVEPGHTVNPIRHGTASGSAQAFVSL